MHELFYVSLHSVGNQYNSWNILEKEIEVKKKTARKPESLQQKSLLEMLYKNNDNINEYTNKEGRKFSRILPLNKEL